MFASIKPFRNEYYYQRDLMEEAEAAAAASAESTEYDEDTT
jgi:hypothetical protein